MSGSAKKSSMDRDRERLDITLQLARYFRLNEHELLEAKAEIDRAFERGRRHAFEEMLGTSVAVIPPVFTIGEQVEKHTGDYTAMGEVRAVFAMKNGAIRFVVEHQAEGGGSFCHIYSEKNLRKVAP